jgi:Ala-tRNA(Pro) deacylase
MSDRDALSQLLNQLGIRWQEYQHEALQTCNDAEALGLERAGRQLKNLFLRDNYGRVHILLLTRAELTVDLKTLAKTQGLSRLGFASSERLMQHLGVKPGCVSGLALFNNVERNVELWLDEGLLEHQQWQCHPFDNRFTWVLEQQDLMRFWQALGYQPQVVALPKQ